jgi:peptidoglycan/xylan/chitin deacetylase (PgdA/CDA1 family)
MKIAQVGAISTTIVILLGVVMVIPPYIQASKPPLVVLLSFSIVDDKNVPQWCQGLSSILKNNNIKATVFVTGKVAERYPECVSVFSGMDVGSQTYSYTNLLSIKEYSTQLDEITNGKLAVDDAGNIDSKIFRAPYGSTDENIYSLLNRSGILADFSYNNQYNKYYNGEFIKFDLTAYNGTSHSVDFFRVLPVDKPIMINFDNTVPIGKIDDFVSHLKSRQILFVDASELTEINLNIHQGDKN